MQSPNVRAGTEEKQRSVFYNTSTTYNTPTHTHTQYTHSTRTVSSGTRITTCPWSPVREKPDRQCPSVPRAGLPAGALSAQQKQQQQEEEEAVGLAGVSGSAQAPRGTRAGTDSCCPVDSRA